MSMFEMYFREKQAFMIFRSKNAHSISFSDRDRLIPRNDGVVASFQYDQQYGRVEFGVWPDSKGNQY